MKAAGKREKILEVCSIKQAKFQRQLSQKTKEYKHNQERLAGVVQEVRFIIDDKNNMISRFMSSKESVDAACMSTFNESIILIDSVITNKIHIIDVLRFNGNKIKADLEGIKKSINKLNIKSGYLQ